MADFRIFFDLEFESLERRHGAGVISIGMASDRGEFYAELADGWSEARCSPFTREQVLPLLSLARPESMADLRVRLLAWLLAHASDDQPLTIVSDHAIDFALLRARVLPRMTSRHSGRWQVMAGDAPIVLRHEIVGGLVKLMADNRNECPHHALSDARSLRQAWLEHEAFYRAQGSAS